MIPALIVLAALAAAGGTLYFAKHGWTHGWARFALRRSIWRIRRKLATLREDER